MKLFFRRLYSTSGGANAVRMKGVHSIYLDAQSTTPLDPRVLDTMLPWLTSAYGNPHSRTHDWGIEAEEAVEAARADVAALIGASEKDIVFTSGATESNNLAIKGVMRFYREKKKHLISVLTEHKCVRDTCRVLSKEGFDVTLLGVRNDGLIDLDELRAAIRRDETALVSVMGVNNEIGVVQPLADIGRICRDAGAFFHTDCAQMAGKLPIDVDACNIDLLSISGHKLYGPKGVGALYVRRRPRVRLDPLLSGGGQERGYRSGTLAPSLVVGLGAACRLAQEEMERDHAHVERLGKFLLSSIRSALPDVVLNGSETARWWGNLNLSFPYVEGESMLMGLKEVAISSGSACTSASLEPSYVLRAIGVQEDLAHTSLRFGIGRFSTEDEVQRAIELCILHYQRLRDMSPLYEMAQEGIDISKIQWVGH